MGYFNNLLLNISKTTFLNLSPSPTYFPPFLIDNIVISPSPIESDLGVLFDSTLSFIPHITAITKSAYYIIIYLELEKYENQLLYLLLKL